jgi:hypothetical protein
MATLRERREEAVNDPSRNTAPELASGNPRIGHRHCGFGSAFRRPPRGCQTARRMAHQGCGKTRVRLSESPREEALRRPERGRAPTGPCSGTSPGTRTDSATGHVVKGGVKDDFRQRAPIGASSGTRAVPPDAACGVCGRALAGRQMPPATAALNRANLCAALGEPGDLLAYVLAKASSLPMADEFSCQCDRQQWLQACSEYDHRGSAACWAALGVTDD